MAADMNNFKAAANTLGVVTWYAIPDCRITPAQLAALAATAGIHGNTPDLGAAADAFRRATSKRQIRSEDKTYRYLVRPVVDDSNEIVRHIVLEHVDKAGKTLSHHTIGSLTFDKARKVILTSMANAGPHTKIAQDMIDGARSDYAEYTTSLTGTELGRWLGRRLDNASRITVHPHGHVYFVPAAYGDEIARLQKFVRSLEPYKVTSAAPPTMWAVAVSDTSEDREMIAAGFKSSMLSDLGGVAGDVAELLGRPSKPETGTVQERISMIAAARLKAEEYKKLIGVHVDEIDAMLAMLAVQVDELLDRATGKKADALIEACQREKLTVTVKDSTARVSMRYRSGRERHVTIRNNSDGWTVSGSRPLATVNAAELKKRPEYKDNGGSRWSVKTGDPDVAMLFVRSAMGFAPSRLAVGA